MEKRGCGPTEEAEDGEDRAGGLGGDSVALSLAIRTSAGGASKNDAAGSLDRGGGESVGMKDCAGICPERDIPAETKMCLVSMATRSVMRPSTKRPVLLM